MLPRLARQVKEGANVLYVGTDSAWDYKSLFFNPSCLTNFVTLDPNSNLNPDIVAPIENCPQVEASSIDLLILIGIYEFVNDKAAMFKEIARVLKPDGLAELSLPGQSAYESPNNYIHPEDVFETIKPLKAKEIYIIGEKDGKPPSSIHILATK